MFEITDIGMKSPDDPPVDENGNPKNPMNELENILTLDGRSGRRFITINHQVVAHAASFIKYDSLYNTFLVSRSLNKSGRRFNS